VTSDGIALFASVVRDLSQRGVRLLATTHFHEIFGFESLTSLTTLGFYTLQTIQTEEGSYLHLYKLIPGRFEGSLGVQCASRTGVKASVVERAQKISHAIEHGVCLSSVIQPYCCCWCSTRFPF